jgi:cobalt-zinc-cadmium efflux system outer membrane protein
LTRVGVATILLIALTAGSARAQQAVPLTYQAALARAMTANPALSAARARRAVNIASRDVAAERLNPEFRAEFARETPKEGYTLAIPWETGGKRGRRLAVADAAIATGDAELAVAVADVQAQVRHAFIARFVAESRLVVLEELRALAQRARDAAQARFDTGDAPRLELLQAQLALADAENQTVATRGEVDATRVSLNAVLGDPLDAATPIDLTLEVGAATAVEASLTTARTANAELAVYDRRLAEQRARLALAKAMQQPDVTPEATLTRRAEPEFSTGWRTAVAISLPVFTTHRAGVRVEEAQLQQLTAEREAVMTRVTGEVASAVAIAQAQRQQFVRYRDDIVPQALEVERMAEDSYRLGQTNIAAYLQALQSTRDVRLRAIQSAAELQNALADLEKAIGAPLTVPPPANR